MKVVVKDSEGKIYIYHSINELITMLNAQFDLMNFELVEENIRGRIGNQDAPPDLIRSLGWKSSKSFEERIKEFVSSTLASS